MSEMRLVDAGRTLAELEQVIEVGVRSYIAAGEALVEIRDRSLYLEHHGSFDAYCKDRWGFTRQRAHQLMQAARVSAVVDPAPTDERQARELASLLGQPRKAQAAWTEARTKSSGAPTAKDVAESVAKRAPKEKLDKATAYAESHPRSNADQIARATGVTIPVAREARRRVPVPAPVKTEKRPKVVDIADRREARSTWRSWQPLTIDPPAEDEIVRWAESIPEDDLGAAVSLLSDRCAALMEAVDVVRARYAASKPPSA